VVYIRLYAPPATCVGPPQFAFCSPCLCGEVGGERKGACEGRSTNRYGKVDVREGVRADGRARIGKKGARIGKKGWTRSMPCGSCYTWYQITADICIGPMV
jgi:hypothetical protein